MALNGAVGVENDVQILGERDWENNELDVYHRWR